MELDRRRTAIYAASFLLGAVIMGFEMVASRIMTPVFGGGIDTWAALISTMLVALTCGYFVGGTLRQGPKLQRRVVALVAAAAFTLALVPLYNATLLLALNNHLGEGPAALLIAAALLVFLPIALLGTFSPCSVELCAGLAPKERSGAIAGRLYGISTLGSVFGTLLTAFVLIPHIGTQNVTLTLAILAAFTAVLLRLTSA